MAGKVISFGYDTHKLVPRTDRVVDVRDLSHNLTTPDVDDLVDRICEEYKQGQYVAIGCNKGQHRSVEIAKRVAKRLGLRVEHRDKSRGRS